MKSRLIVLLSRLFGPPEEINGAERCPTYLYRWKLWGGRHGRAAYLHRFVGDDWSRDMHDHPKRFVSIGLWGSYVELTPDFGGKVYRAPWFRTFPAEHTHRLALIGRECWTLVIVLRTEREWGFWVDGTWVPWRRYVRTHLADGRTACE